MKRIKGILMDYGGTIDTNGLHWGTVLWKSYEQQGVVIEKALFSKAYAFGEKALAINPLVKSNHTFLDVLKLKIHQQFEFLHQQGHPQDSSKIDEIAKACHDFARTTVEANKGVLEKLAQAFPIVLVSNFYGNLNTVLSGFGIRDYFADVVESAVVRIRKPDPRIYRMGVDRLGLLPQECVVIGDSYNKDIIPAKEIGCNVVWLNVEGWGEAGTDELKIADAEIKDFSQLIGLILERQEI